MPKRHSQGCKLFNHLPARLKRNKQKTNSIKLILKSWRAHLLFTFNSVLKPLVSQSLPTKTLADCLSRQNSFCSNTSTDKLYLTQVNVATENRNVNYIKLFSHSINTPFWSLPKLLPNSQLLNPGFQILRHLTHYLIQAGFAQNSIKKNPKPPHNQTTKTQEKPL